MHQMITVLILISCFASSSAAQPRYDILAVEYPPFSSEIMPSGGLVFQLLSARLGNSVRFKPVFVPPARAAQMIKADNWCATFYPPSDDVVSEKWPLTEHTVKIGLYRLKQESPFSWQNLSELTGVVALLRTREHSPFSQQFIDAGFDIVWIEEPSQGIELLLKGRVDYSIGDDMLGNRGRTYNTFWSGVQFSDTVLFETPVMLYTNPSCELSTIMRHSYN